MDPLRDFFADRCIVYPTVWVSAADFRSGYEKWAHEAGEPILGSKAVAERLRVRGCVPANRKVFGVSTRGWEGVSLRAPESEVDG